VAIIYFLFYFEPETEYVLKVYPVNPNGNSDLNFSNDTLVMVYNFSRDYRFDINEFISPQPVAFDGEQEVSIAFTNISNASFIDEVYVNWSVNGVEQNPVSIEDIQGENILVLGDYYFEVDKDYEIKASIEIPTYDNLPLDQIHYILDKNGARADLAIVSVERSTINPNAILVRIENNGNVDIDDFIVNWTYNDVPQEPITGSNNNWRWYAEGVFFNKYTTVRIDSFTFDESIKHIFDFSVDLPGNYIDANPDNNSFTFETEPVIPGEEKPDQVYTICEGDSITLQVREFTHYPDAFGISLGCTECEVSFNNQEWTVNDRIITETNSITVKPTVTGIFTFSTDAFENCFRICGGGPSGGSSGNYDQPDVRIKVIVEACPKQEVNCLNNFGRVGYRKDENGNRNEIRPFVGNSFLSYDANGNSIDLKGDYVRFDYEIKGPVLADGSYQPITITCLEEIYEDIPVQRAYFDDLCPGDEIQESLKIPSQIGTEYDAVICDILQDQFTNNLFVESSLSDDCVFNFTVNDISEEQYTSFIYDIQLQTVDRPHPLNLIWDFEFSYKQGCDISCSNTPGLMQTSSTFVCAGKSVFVREAFSSIDENSVKVYVLHEEKKFDGINYIALQKEGRFTNPGASYNNQPLYISAVIGPAGEDGSPILDSACTVWTPYGAKYTFFNPVEINVVDEKCEDGEFYVDVILNGGIGDVSPNWSYRSVSDGTKSYENVSVGEMVTFGPYEGAGEYKIEAHGAKGCRAEYTGMYNCGIINRNASVKWKGSDIFEIKYAYPDLVIEAAQVFNTNGQRIPANIKIDHNSSVIELQNQPNGSLFFVQFLIIDNKTSKSSLISEKLFKN